MQDGSHVPPEMDSLKAFWQDPEQRPEFIRGAAIAFVALNVGGLASAHVIRDINDIPELQDQLKSAREHVDQHSEQQTITEIEGKYHHAVDVGDAEVATVGILLAAACGAGYIAVRFRSWRNEVRQSVAYKNEQRRIEAKNKDSGAKPTPSTHRQIKKSLADRSNVIPFDRKKHFR